MDTKARVFFGFTSEAKKKSPLVSKAKFSNQSRSISLPTSSHSKLIVAEKNLRRLKSSDCASSSSTRSTSHQLEDGLTNLYDCLDRVLHLTESQKLLTQERDKRWEEEILDGSLRLLDICSTARDTYTLMKESVHELESSLRRKRSGGNLDNEMDVYIASKKKLNGVISKCYKEVKREGKKYSISSAPLINQFKEAQEITLNLLQSCHSFILDPQPKGCSLVSKLLARNKRESEVSEIQSIEVELLLLNNSKKSNKDVDLVRTLNLVRRLGALGSSIEEIVEVLETVYRLLLEGRVSLLNILSN